jgi:hypothetical protein
MPTIICAEATCPLTSLNPLPKFCPDCGCLASSKVVSNPSCTNCSHEFVGAAPRFCPECGSKVASPAEQPENIFAAYGLERPTGPVEPGAKVYGSVGDLIQAHEARKASRGVPGGAQGRGLTPAELERMERTARASTPANRKYVPPTGPVADVFKSADDIEDTPENRARAGLGEHRVAQYGEEGKHRVGGLAPKGAGLDAGYASDVRLIPYKFNHAARNGRHVIQDTPAERVERERAERARRFGTEAAGNGQLFDATEAIRLLNEDAKAEGITFEPEAEDLDRTDIDFPPRNEEL